jgi:hypothetical protein
MKTWAVALAALLCAAPTTSEAGPPPYSHDEAAIVRVFCTNPLGTSVGTAVKVGPGEYITAAHVVDSGQCHIGIVPIVVTHLDKLRDFATFTGPVSAAVVRISCDGFKPGRVYEARGFAGGEFTNISFPWQATELASWPWTVFVGEAIPGMSGGPLIDRKGRVTGVVNMRWPARSLPLSRTGLCQ